MTEHFPTSDASMLGPGYTFDNATSSAGGLVGKVASWGLMASGMLGIAVTGAPLPNTLGSQQYIMRVETTSSTSGDAFWPEAAAFLGADETTDTGNHNQETTQRVIGELRRLSGLTWAQLAEVFDVSRRTLHFWASGEGLNAANEARLHQIYDIVKQAYRGDATTTRTAILEVTEGASALERLAAGEFEQARTMLGRGVEVPARPKAKLSAAARAARQPLAPEALVGAMQERVHRDIGRGRAAKTVRNGAGKRDG